MTRATKIDFATSTLPLVTGCSKDGNAGCKNCYAAFQVAGRLRHLPSYEGLAFFDKNGDAQWTGKVRCNEFILTEPLRTKRPQRYFVAPRGDLTTVRKCCASAKRKQVTCLMAANIWRCRND